MNNSSTPAPDSHSNDPSQEEPKRPRRRRRRHTPKVTPKHWLNLSLYILAAIIVLLGATTLGRGASSCLFGEPISPQIPTEHLPEKTIK